MTIVLKYYLKKKYFSEYNPKLSDATKGTRVAYVKFMKGTFKPNKDDVSIVDETKSALSRTSSKAIVDFTASIKKVIVSRT